MADDPFSIWGEPPPPSASSESTAASNGTTLSLDTIDLAAGVSGKSITSPPKLFSDELAALDPAWDSPASPGLDPVGKGDENGLTDASKLAEAGQEAMTVSDGEKAPPLGEFTDKLSLGADTIASSSSIRSPAVSASTGPQSFTGVDSAQPVSSSSLPSTEIVSVDDDEFEDFGDATEGLGEGVDDDFGDFGDFDEGPHLEEASIDNVAPLPVVTAVKQDIPLKQCLSVSPGCSGAELAADIRNILAAPLVAGSHAYPFHDGAEAQLGKEELRQVEGLSQVLITEGSRKLWTSLSELSTVKPVDWTRSRTRREQLISLGIPINLDEIRDGPSRPRALPPLKLQFDNSSSSRDGGPSSAPTERTTPKRSATALPAETRNRVASSTQNTPRSGSPALGVGVGSARLAQKRREDLGLAAAPELAWDRAEEVITMTEEQLSLQSVAYLRALSRELHSLTTTASSLLTHHLTLRESHAADSEMYNTMIRDLVAGATSRFGGPGGAGGSSSKKDDRRATVIGGGSHARGASGGRP